MIRQLRTVALRAGRPLRGSRYFSHSSRTDAKVGFVGLGNMGKHMANNLIKAGHTLTVFDMNKDALEEAKKQGATVADSAEGVAEGAEAIVTMLPSNPHVLSVYNKHLLSAAKEETLLIDCSTIDPNVTREIQAEAERRKLPMVDAPVSGGVLGAEAATLTFMVGGSKQAFDRASEFLHVMGKNVVHCGDAGTGQIAKLCNNLVLGISMSAVAEAMGLGVKLGADPEVLASIINTSSGRCWSSDTYNPCPGVMDVRGCYQYKQTRPRNVPSSRGYTGGFGTALMRKDLGLALDAAKVVDVALPTGAVAHSLYTIMSRHGYAGKDFSSIFDYLHMHDKKE